MTRDGLDQRVEVIQRTVLELQRLLGRRSVRSEETTALLEELSARVEELHADSKEAEQRLANQAQLIAEVNDAIIAVDGKLRLTAWNRAAEQTYGWKAEEVLGRPSHDVLRWDGNAVERQEAIRLLRETGQYRGEVVHLHKDGTPICVEAVAIAIRGPSGRITGYISVNRDISRRKARERRAAAQDAVNQVLTRAGSLVDATPRILQAICEALDWELGELWQVDPAADVLRWVDMWKRSSLDANEFAKISREMTLMPDDGLPGRVWATRQAAWVSDVLAEPGFGRSPVAARLGLHGAFAFPIQTAGSVRGIMAFFSRQVREPDGEILRMSNALGRQLGDFIERERAESALRESERRFAEFMRHMPGVAFIKDVQGRYLYVNEPFEDVFHQRLPDLLGKTDDEIWPATVASQLKENDSRVIKGQKALQTIESVPQDDGPHEWLVTKFPILNQQGNPVMLAGLAIDITERRHVEAQIRDLQRLAAQRDRLSDIGAVAAQVVHDLGNPMAALSMQAQLLVRRARRGGDQPASALLTAAEQIATQARRLDVLVKDLMSFAREQRLDLKPIGLRRFLQELADAWRPVAGEHAIGITLEEPSGRTRVSGDVEKLRRVFDNLLKNAVEAIGEGPGQIGIRCTPISGGKIRISIEDTGCGIPETVHAFRLFETTKPQGTGLGLAIARQIVHAHGGEIEFKALEPTGTVFHVDIPVEQPSG